MNNLTKLAMRYLNAGMCPFPIAYATKVPAVSWKRYQNTPPTENQLRAWFNNGKFKSIGTACGKGSGNLCVLDFDEPGFYERWKEIVGNIAEELPTQRTGGGGYQAFFRCDDPGRNQKLAKIEKEGEVCVAIETRAEGGYVVLPPSLHPEGGIYKWLPNTAGKIPHILQDNVNMMFNAARSLNEIEEEPEEFIKAKSESPRRRQGGNVIEAYNQAHDVETLLLSYGYTKRGRYLCRPGAPDRHSVWLHEGKSFHHSTNDPLHSEHLRDAFDVYAHFEHGGQYKEAVRAAAGEMGIELKPRAAAGDASPFEAEPEVAIEPPFWCAKRIKKDVYVPQILQHRVSAYLHGRGFTKIYPRGETESIFVRIMDNVCSMSSAGQMKDFFMEYVRSFPDVLPEVDECAFEKNEVIERLEKGASTHFGTAQLECIPTATPHFSRDKRDRAYFYYQNGYAVVTRNGTEFHNYGDLEGVIWENQKLRREYRKADSPDGEFSRFLFNVCGQDLGRLGALRTALGYMLHQYKDRAIAKAVVFVDETISETPEGRSGKSLVSTALCHLRNGLLLDGKKLNFESPFVFQSVELDTDIVVMDDVIKSFNYEMIFHMITSDFTVERKGEHQKKIDFEDAPKILISTNYMIQGEGGSADARKMEYEFSDHYNAGYSPRDEFGHNLFDDWTPEEWARFDQFMMDSVTLYLQSGLTEPVSINIKERKLLQATCQDFIDFMDAKVTKSELLEVWIPRNLLLDELCANSEDCNRNRERGKLNAHKFSAWLKSFERARGLELTERVMKWEGKSVRGILFSKK